VVSKEHSPKGSLCGIVTDKVGKPIEFAYLTVTGKSPEHHDIAALTNGNGKYELGDLYPGNYEILLDVEGYPKTSKQVYVSARNVTILDFVV
jgi:carboxypeptidase family protein